MSDSPFPFDVEFSVADLLRMPMGQFYPQFRNDTVYYHGRLPSLNPTSDGSNSSSPTRAPIHLYTIVKFA